MLMLYFFCENVVAVLDKDGSTPNSREKAGKALGQVLVRRMELAQQDETTRKSGPNRLRLMRLDTFGGSLKRTEAAAVPSQQLGNWQSRVDSLEREKEWAGEQARSAINGFIDDATDKQDQSYAGRRGAIVGLACASFVTLVTVVWVAFVLARTKLSDGQVCDHNDVESGSLLWGSSSLGKSAIWLGAGFFLFCGMVASLGSMSTIALFRPALLPLLFVTIMLGITPLVLLFHGVEDAPLSPHQQWVLWLLLVRGVCVAAEAVAAWWTYLDLETMAQSHPPDLDEAQTQSMEAFFATIEPAIQTCVVFVMSLLLSQGLGLWSGMRLLCGLSNANYGLCSVLLYSYTNGLAMSYPPGGCSFTTSLLTSASVVAYLASLTWKVRSWILVLTLATTRKLQRYENLEQVVEQAIVCGERQRDFAGVDLPDDGRKDLLSSSHLSAKEQVVRAFQDYRESASFQEDGLSPEDRMCCICMEREASTVLVPCTHGGFCSTCAVRLQSASALCPICRSDILGYMSFNVKR